MSKSTGEERSVWGRTTSTLALISFEKAWKGVRLEGEAGPGPVWALFCRCWEAMYSPADTYRAPARCLGLLQVLRTPHCTIQTRTLRVRGGGPNSQAGKTNDTGEKSQNGNRKLREKQFKIGDRDFPGCTVVKNPPANAGDTGSSPGPGRSHMLRAAEQLSPCATTTEPELYSP